MNILFVQNDLNPSSGGIARVSNLLSTYFKKLGHHVYFLYYLSDNPTINANHKFKYTLTMDSAQMYAQVADYVRSIPGGVNIVIIQALFFKSIKTTFVRLREECGFKIISCLHCTPKSMLQPIKGNFVEHAKNFIRWITGRHVVQVMRAMYQASDCFVLLSDSFRNEFQKGFGIKDLSKCIAIPNPLTFDTFTTPEQIIQKKNIALIVARMHEESKNLKAAFRVWKSIENSQTTSNWYLQLAGHGGDEQMILDYASSLKLQRFVFLGRTDNPLELYKEASIFMMTSWYEGFGMTLTEAQQNGVVPIAFGSFGTVYDIIKDGESGYIISPYDEEQYAQKLMGLMINNELRRKMAISASQSCRKFSIETIGLQWQELFEMCQKGK